jgi:hypothetical protein
MSKRTDRKAEEDLDRIKRRVLRRCMRAVATNLAPDARRRVEHHIKHALSEAFEALEGRIRKPAEDAEPVTKSND